MKSRMLRPAESTSRSRRTATVMQSAPESSSASAISSYVAYLPVPTISRLASVWVPNRSGESIASSATVAAMGGVADASGMATILLRRARRFPSGRRRPASARGGWRGAPSSRLISTATILGESCNSASNVATVAPEGTSRDLPLQRMVIEWLKKTAAQQGPQRGQGRQGTRIRNGERNGTAF